MKSNEIRKLLPSTCWQDFDDIVEGRTLGASNHIKMISVMYEAIAKNNSDEEAKSIILKVGDFFKETRGKSSYAIILALTKIEKKIQASSKDYAKSVQKACNDYFEEAVTDLKKVLDYSRNLMHNMNNVMLFDYSSTVEKAVNNADHKLHVYIPESRAINGGYPFVKGIVLTGHHVHFIPDASMLSVLKQMDAAFIGAETFYPDGTAFNTVGSDILAELCKIYKVPYYVITPLIKGDIRAKYGIYKETLFKDAKEHLAKDWPEDLKEKVDFKTIELVGVEPELISGYITEKGILKTSDLFSLVCEEENL